MSPPNTGAIIKAAQDPKFEVGPVPYPTLQPNTVIIKTAAVAINPVDWMVRDFAFVPLEYPTVLGADVAGVVVEVGADVRGVKAGQRVLAHAGYFIPGIATGTFQEYVLALGVTTVPIPDSLPFESAAVIPLCFSTAAAGLYEKDMLALPYPSATLHKDQVVFVWGGSTSVGSAAIQLARASGCEVFASAGSKNKDYLIELGVSPAHVFDHSKDNVVEAIATALHGKKLIGVFDCITNDSSKQFCRDIAQAGALDSIIGVLPVAAEETSGATYKSIRAITVWFSDVAPALFAGYLQDALERGDYMARPRPKVVGRKLEDLTEALDQLKAGVSAQKLVVTL